MDVDMDAADMGPIPDKLDRSSELFIVQSVFLILAGICVILRAIVKTCVVKLNSLDDYLIYGAMAGYLAYGTISLDGAVNGATGKHISLGYTMDQASRSLKAWYLCMVLYAPITLTIRASVCVLLLRMSATKMHRRIIWTNFAIIAVVSMAFFFVLVFQCNPPSHFWTQVHGSDGYCHSNLIVFYSTTVHSCASALSDWCLGLMPIALLWNVNINRRTKAIIAFLLSLGMIAGIVLIVRIPYVTRLDPGFEFLYKSVDVGIWSVMEPALGIIAACVATFRPLFRSWGFGWTSVARTRHSRRLQRSGARKSGRSFHGEAIRAAHLRPEANNGDDVHGDDDDVESNSSELSLNISKVVEIEVVSERKEELGAPSNRGNMGTFYKEMSDSEMGTAISRW